MTQPPQTPPTRQPPLGQPPLGQPQPSGRPRPPGQLARPTTATRVVLADDAVFLREAVAGVLEQHGFDVVAQVAEPVALHEAVGALHPEIAVVDIRMPPTHRLEGLEAAIDIRRRHPNVGVLLLSQYLESHYLPRLLGAGSRGVGYLLKERVASTAVFLDAVRRVAAGGCALDPEVVAAQMNRLRRHDPLDRLSERELEVLSLMAEGRSNRSIGSQLVLTPRTVESHVRSIFNRLGLPPEPEHHRRVLAVLAFLKGASTNG